MQLSLRDAARVLKVTENVVTRWVRDLGLPAAQINGQYRFNRAELLEWATVRKMEISPTLFQDSGDQPTLEQALRLGGVLHKVPGADKTAVLQAVIASMPLPEDVDRDFLVEMFLSREALGSTNMGEGLAFPHPRYPVVLPVDHAFITLCFLEQAIQYSATAEQPVHTLFALVSPTVRCHLGLLARLAVALRDEGFRTLIRNRSSAEEIFEGARRVEEALKGPARTEAK